MTTEKRKPVHELRLGGVKAAIWENQSVKTGTWYSVTVAPEIALPSAASVTVPLGSNSCRWPTWFRIEPPVQST